MSRCAQTGRAVVRAVVRVRGAGVVLAGVLGLAACQTQMEPAPICNMESISRQRGLVAAPAAVPGLDPPVIEMPLNSVSITDATLINKLYVRSANARRTPTGTVEVYSQILNCTDYPLQAEARTQFYDGGQAPSEPVSGWRRLPLPPRSSTTYRESSIGNTAVQFYMVEVREGR